MPKYSYRKAKRTGKKDGRDWRYSFWPFKSEKIQEPKPDQELPAQFEVELLKAAENDISKEAENWQKRDKELKPKYCTALQRVEQAQKEHLKESEEADLARSDYENARTKYEEFTLPSLSEKWRNWGLIFLAVAEFPLNSVVFELFGASRLHTYLMSLALCVIIPLFGHYWGEIIKQDNKSAGEKGFLLGIPFLILLIMGAVAFIRAKFFESMKAFELLGVEISAAQITILFIIINTGIFLAAVIISYEACHPNKRQFKSVKRRYKEALKRLEKEATEAKEAGRALARAENQFQALRQQRAKSHENFVQKANTIIDYCEWLISTYRGANMKVRKTIPTCFKNGPSIPRIPEELLELDWECAKLQQGEVS